MVNERSKVMLTAASSSRRMRILARGRGYVRPFSPGRLIESARERAYPGREAAEVNETAPCDAQGGDRGVRHGLSRARAPGRHRGAVGRGDKTRAASLSP